MVVAKREIRIINKLFDELIKLFEKKKKIHDKIKRKNSQELNKDLVEKTVKEFDEIEKEIIYHLKDYIKKEGFNTDTFDDVFNSLYRLKQDFYYYIENQKDLRHLDEFRIRSKNVFQLFLKEQQY